MNDWDSEGGPRKPTVIGIGAQKAGTTWLSQILGQHPKIWAPPFKEVQFFNARYIPEHMAWLPWHFRRSKLNLQKRYVARDEDMPPELVQYLDRITREPMFTNHWYKQVFAPMPQDKLGLDVTPEYSTLPEEGVEFVAKFLNKCRFIYLIRHPVDRAISQLKMNLSRKNRRPKTVEEWMVEIEDPVLLDRGDYATYVPRWNKHFGAERLLYLPYGMIARDPLGLMRRVERFLELEAYDYENLGQRVFAGPKGLNVPDQVRARLRQKLEPQFDFLNSHFPADFTVLLR